MNQENSKKEKISIFDIPEEMTNINLKNESLKLLEPETDYVSMMRKFKDILNNKDSDWHLLIAVINYFRRMFKFEKKVFFQFFYGAKFYQRIVELINSFRSSLAKNAITLLTEIFSGPISKPEEKEITSLITVIQSTIPYLISNVSSYKSFIKIESNKCLDSIIQNVKYLEVLLCFMQLMNSKKNKDSQLCTELSIKMIKSLGKDFFVKNSRFGELLKCVVSFYEAQKNTNLRKCRNILDCFVEVMGKECFEIKLDKCGYKEKNIIKTIMGATFAEIKKSLKISSSSHFHKEIRERKKTFILSNCDNNNTIKTSFSLTIKIIPKRRDSMNIGPKNLKLID